MKSFSKAFGRIVLILTVVIALVASVFVVPKLFGINPYVVLSGSMEPQIHTGAIAFVNTKDTAVKVGDVVTYRLANDELVTHRIIKKDQSEYTFQGDANDNPDAHTVTQDQIVGKYLFSIPKVGFLISALGKKGMPVIIAWIIILNIMSLILESTCSSGDVNELTSTDLRYLAAFYLGGAVYRNSMVTGKIFKDYCGPSKYPIRNYAKVLQVTAKKYSH